jgi:von Willebrand factor type A domain/Common central domain of tyrosinase
MQLNHRLFHHSSVRAGQWMSMLFLIMAMSIVIGTNPVAADLDHEIDTIDWVATPIADVDGFFSTPWGCDMFGVPDPGTQDMLQFHYNWHCSNRDNVGINWGNRFFGFHKQFLLGYDRFLASRGEPFVKTWVAGKDVPIPPSHSGRPKGTPCTSCIDLPLAFQLGSVVNGGTLENFQSISDIGAAIVTWHNTNHGNIAAAGGTGGCAGAPDMNCPNVSPNDPIFYRYHHIFDDVQDAWRTSKPADIAIVLDRSGSMSLPTNGGGTRLDAAKSAASLFADLLEDGSSHKLGMVSFSTTASTVADMPLTDVAGAPAALSAALANLVPFGSTSIGDGLQKAQTLIASGSEARKAILLLTDGQENTSPSIADIEQALGDTHVCSIGFGTPGTIEGPKLQDLSQRQGGIYITTPDSLLLKKYFVFCFANIFDTFIGEDPVDILPAGQLTSSPTIHHSVLDQKLVFILGWTNPAPPGALQLSITMPSGAVLDLSSPGVRSKFGPTWHIVRVKLPYYGEQNGDWAARAIRPIHSYVNGFSSRSFDNFEEGVTLVLNELASLCPYGCHNILYYEDPTVFHNFADMNSIYREALFRQASQGLVGSITRPDNATEFSNALQHGFGEEGFDLLVYSSQFLDTEQPYDGLLAQILCTDRPLAIISDNRHTRGARDILRCAGAIRGDRTNFTTLVPTNSSLFEGPVILRAPNSLNVFDFSYELLPVNGSMTQAIGGSDAAAIVAQGKAGNDERFFITLLTRSVAKVKPFLFRNNTYTLEDLHPAFHIPAMYWPKCGFDKVSATVNVTRPLRSLAETLASVGTTNASSLQGDSLTPRQVAGQHLEQQNIVIPTESKQFKLYDDGTHGDETANDHYWEVSLPQEFTTFDGDYLLHAIFKLCSCNRCDEETCIQREIQQTITVRTQMHPNSKVTVEKLPSYGGRSRSRICITPADERGTLVGPGLVDELIFTPIGDAMIESKSDWDGRGTYQIIVNWEDNQDQKPGLMIAQYGRPKNAIRVKLC